MEQPIWGAECYFFIACTRVIKYKCCIPTFILVVNYMCSHNCPGADWWKRAARHQIIRSDSVAVAGAARVSLLTERTASCAYYQLNF